MVLQTVVIKQHGQSLLQSTIEVCYKVRQVLKSMTDFITKCGGYYKVRRNSGINLDRLNKCLLAGGGGKQKE